MDYFTNALKKYADFSGRETRKSYWMFILFYIIFYIVAAVMGSVLGTFLITVIYALGMLVPTISILARRLHDTSRSGWWILISFVPVIGSLVLLIFTVMDSHDDNQYGSNPKGE